MVMSMKIIGGIKCNKKTNTADDHCKQNTETIEHKRHLNPKAGNPWKLKAIKAACHGFG